MLDLRLDLRTKTFRKNLFLSSETYYKNNSFFFYLISLVFSSSYFIYPYSLFFYPLSPLFDIRGYHHCDSHETIICLLWTSFEGLLNTLNAIVLTIIET